MTESPSISSSAVVRAERAPNLWRREVVHGEIQTLEMRARSARRETTERQSYASGEDQRELPQAHRRHEDPRHDAAGPKHTRERAHDRREVSGAVESAEVGEHRVIRPAIDPIELRERTLLDRDSLTESLTIDLVAQPLQHARRDVGRMHAESLSSEVHGVGPGARVQLEDPRAGRQMTGQMRVHLVTHPGLMRMVLGESVVSLGRARECLSDRDEIRHASCILG